MLPSSIVDCELKELQHPLRLCAYRDGTTLVGRGWRYKPDPPDMQGWEKENGPLIII